MTQRKAPLPTLSPRWRGVVEPRQHIELSCRCEGATHVDMLTTLDILSFHCEVPEVRHHVRQYSCALLCHCEGERSEAVAIAKSLEFNEITTSCATPRNDKNFGSLCKVQDDKYVSEAHRKELNVLTSYRLNDFKKKIAFTLAEVLITLAIIGVVAAMTIPTLMVNYQKKATASKVKKAYAELAQGLKLAQAEYGDPDMWVINKYTDSAENTKYFSETFIFPYIKVSKICGTGDEAAENCEIDSCGAQSYNFILNNGVGVSVAAYSYGNAITFSLTVNPGKSIINGKDFFVFVVQRNVMSKGLLPYGYTEGISRDDIKSGYSMNYSTSEIKVSCVPYAGESYNEDTETYTRHACTYLLWLDNWEFKDDYPW